MNGFQHDLIKAAKALAYAHRACKDMDREHEDFQLAVFAVSNSLDMLDAAVTDLDEYEDRKKSS